MGRGEGRQAAAGEDERHSWDAEAEDDSQPDLRPNPQRVPLVMKERTPFGNKAAKINERPIELKVQEQWRIEPLEHLKRLI